MTYAIIEDSGGQMMAAVGEELTIDLRALPEGAASVTFDRVLLIGGEGEARFGRPYLAGAGVAAEIVDADFKDEKIQVMKFRRRKGYRRKTGHRQRLMKVRITSIDG